MPPAEEGGVGICKGVVSGMGATKLGTGRSYRETETLRDRSEVAAGLETDDDVGDGRLLSTGRGPFAFSGTNGGSVGSIARSAAVGGLLIGFMVSMSLDL